MKKFITKLIITAVFAQHALSIFVGTNILKAYADTTPTTVPIVVASENIRNTDLRVVALEKVFKKYNSPLEPYASDFVKTADKYNVDWKLLPAISGLESSFGVYQMAGSYNSYGWGGGRIYFPSWESGIDTVISGLKTNYIGDNSYSPYTIGPTYSESPTWAPRVERFMDEIDLEYSELKAQQIPLTI